MYTRKINLVEIVSDAECLPEEVIEKLVDNYGHLSRYELEYSVRLRYPFSDDDYVILPTPCDVAEECSNVMYEAVIAISGGVSEEEYLEISKWIQLDAEWWGNENWEMLLEMNEDE